MLLLLVVVVLSIAPRLARTTVGSMALVLSVALNLLVLVYTCVPAVLRYTLLA